MEQKKQNGQNLKTFDFVGSTIVDIVNNILYDAASLGASDIHFDPWENNLKIRIRVDGVLKDYALVANENK